jgi:streptogramin lyase
MRASYLSTYVLSVYAAVAVLAGCSGGGSTPSSFSPSVGSGGASLVVTPDSTVRRAVKRGPNVFVADAGKSAVYEILSAGGYTQVIKLGSGFSKPLGVAVDAKGDVYVADTGNNAVKEMLAVKGGIPKKPVIKTLTTAIPNPYNVALDYSNNAFVTNNTGTSVYELLAPKYNKINQLGSFTFPTSVAVDSDANVYVGTAAGTSEVYEMLAPAYQTVYTLGGYYEFLNPYGLAVDRHGNVYIGDYNNSAVQMMPPNCFSSSCIATLTTKFYRPVGVAVDRSGNVYGGDAATGEVFEILRAGGYKTINALGSGFKIPWGIAVH